VELERIRRGDEQALAALLGEGWEPLVRYLVSLLGTVDAAEDAAQEAFVRLWERREGWGGGSARAVLFRIARNVAMDALRRDGTRRRYVRRQPLPQPSLAAPEQELELERRQLEERFHRALKRLPPARREVFELVRFRGLRHAEVAEVLGLSPQTVANHMGLALRDLREMLADPPAVHPPKEDIERGRSTHG
jgi:RNA polymerase sigma-19 factor, ECF subfamily